MANSSLTVRYKTVKNRQYVYVNDILTAMERYPYWRVIRILQGVAEKSQTASIADDPITDTLVQEEVKPAESVVASETDVKTETGLEQPVQEDKPVSLDDRIALWSNPACQVILERVSGLSTDDDGFRRLVKADTIAEAIVLDFILSAFVQRNTTGIIDFLNPVVEKMPPDPDTINQRSISFDLSVLAQHIYPGDDHPNISESRARWIKTFKKHAGTLVRYGYLSYSAPKEGEAGNIFIAELSAHTSARMYSDHNRWDSSNEVWIDYLPVYMMKFGRGYVRQQGSSYTCPRFLYTWLGLNYRGDYPLKLSFDVLASAVKLQGYTDWRNLPASDGSPVSYMTDVIRPCFPVIPFKITEVDETEYAEISPCVEGIITKTL